MKKVICFARVSTKQQDLDAQLIAVTNAAKKDGYKQSEILVVKGKESAIKLDEEERETISELLELIEQNPTVTTVYFFAIDRLARRVSVVLSVVEKLTLKEVNLVFLNPYRLETMQFKNGRWSINPMSTMFLQFLSIGAAMEMAIKKERFVVTRNLMRSNGQLLNAKVPFGWYRDRNGFAQVKEEEAVVVRRIFNDYVENGKTMAQIGTELVQEGIWRQVSRVGLTKRVSNIIINLAYSGGQPLQRDSALPKTSVFPPIVSRELQERAIAIASDKNKPKGQTKYTFFGKGILRLQLEDGSSFAMSPYVSNVAYQWQDGRDGKTTAQFNVNANVVDHILWSEARLIYKVKQMRDMTTAPIEINNSIEVEKRKLANINNAIEEINRKRKKAAKMAILADMTEDELQDILGDLAKQLRPWQIEKAKVESEISKLEAMLEAKSSKTFDISMDSLDSLDDNSKRKIVMETINSMISKKIGKYEYEFRLEPSIDVPTRTWKYSSKGGVKKLYFKDLNGEWTDVSKLVVERFHNPRNKK